MDPKITGLYNDYIHGDMPRRSFLKKLAVITGGATMANSVLMHYAGDDKRVNAMIPDFRASLDENKVAYSLHMYPGTGHGFHNDTSQTRYDEAAASLSW